MPPTARLRIAIADKNPHVREFLCRELAQAGHEAHALSGAADIVAGLAAAEPPQVLVLDPEAAGERLAEVARALAAAPGRVAVVLHVFADAEPLSGFDGALVVEKQPRMDALMAALAALAEEIPAPLGVVA